MKEDRDFVAATPTRHPYEIRSGLIGFALIPLLSHSHSPKTDIILFVPEEERAFRVAWSAVKHDYEKGDHGECDKKPE
ncbi:ChaB family protein [Anabaena sp. CCY 9402-a]|uniref:ChaB family protein n=1 Tax=Anabaena sp. CCY 9402-a TaxID=3103867 RepID=UPI0039C5ED0E